MIEIKKPEIFSFSECLWFLDRNYDDCLYSVKEQSVLKLLEVEGMKVLFEIKERGDSLIIEVLNDWNHSSEILVNYVEEWFDINRNLSPFYKKLEKDPDLAFMTQEYYGLRLMGIPSLFESLCWSIIGQQINLAFAYKTKRALVEKYGESYEYDNQIFHLFPTPKILSRLTPAELRKIQFSRQKSEYIIGIAKLFQEGIVSKSALLDLKDESAILKELTKIRGVGEWTANYAMMKCLKRPNAVTYGDVGLYQALATIKGFPRRPSKEQIDRLFDGFTGWKSYLNLYLWRSLAPPTYNTTKK